MPLFHFANELPFFHPFCFLVGESEDEYTCAIEQFKTIIREQDFRVPNVVTDNCHAMEMR
jgi:hypothetical protein